MFQAESPQEKRIVIEDDKKHPTTTIPDTPFTAEVILQVKWDHVVGLDSAKRV